MATTPYPFVAGAVLTASQLNSTFNVPVNNQTASYVLLASDGGKRVVMNAAGATTITVNTSLFSAGDSVWIHNIGAGTCTITAGTATVNTAATLALAQWEGGLLYFTSASTAIFFRGGGTTYGVATGGTDLGTRTIGGVDYKVLEFTSGGTLTITKAGLFDVLLIGGGGGAWQVSTNTAGGGAGGYIEGQAYFSINQTIVIGAGGAANDKGSPTAIQSGASLAISIIALGGGAGGNAYFPANLHTGGSGGGGHNTTGAVSLLGQGNNGGSGAGGFSGGGGGGAGGVGGNNGGAGGAGKDISTYVGGSASTRAAGGGGSNSGSAGGANTGDGGANNNAGGSGVVFIRFKV